MKKSFVSVLALSFLMIGGSAWQVDANPCNRACHHVNSQNRQTCVDTCNQCKASCAQDKSGNSCRGSCNTAAKNAS